MAAVGVLFGFVSIVAANVLADAGHAGVAVVLAVVGMAVAVGTTLAGAVRGER